MYFTKLPIIKTDVSENIFYGIIDASGSMLNCWEDLVQNYNQSIPENSFTITFDEKARINPQKELTKNLTNHGGGYTNIVAAFQLFEQELNKVQNKKVTVLFISDGEDNYDYMFEQRFNTLKGNINNLELNFLVLGLGTQFSLKTAIRFRNLYHTGNPDLTQIYYLEEPDVKNLIMTFEILKNQLIFTNKVKTDQDYLSYPFEEKKDNFYTGQWLLIDQNKLCISNEELDISQDKYNPKGISQCFKKWANRLKLDRQLGNQDSIQNSQKTLKFMNQILEDYYKQYDINLKQKKFQFQTNKNKSKFYQRIQNKYMFSIHRQIQQALQTVEEISQSENNLNWNLVQAIDKISKKEPVITQNKNKANTKLQFINFNELKKSFIQICKKMDINKIDINSESLNLLKVNDFLEAFQMISNSHQLCQSFPLKGFGVYQKKQDMQIFYPWVCTIKKIALKERQFKSIEMFDNYGQIKIKNYPKKPYFINSVLPLFNESDNHKLSIILYSDLFQLLLNNNCTKKSDLKIQEGHLSFLGNCLIYLLSKKNQNLEKKQIIKQIFDNLKYQEEISVSFAQVINKLNEKGDFQQIIQIEVKNLMDQLKQFEISRILTQILLKFKRIQDTTEQRLFLKNSLQYLIFLYIKLAKSVSCYKYFNLDFFNTKSGLQMQQEIKEQMRQKFKEFKTLGDFNDELNKLYRDKLKTSNPKLTIKNQQQLEKLFSDKINVLNLINIWQNLLEEEFDMRLLEDIIFYSNATDNLDTINFDKIDDEILKKGYKKVQFKALSKKVFPKVKKIKTLKQPCRSSTRRSQRGRRVFRRANKSNQQEEIERIIKIYDNRMLEISEFKQLKKEIKDEYRQFFKKIHYEVMPISSKEIDKLISENTKLKKRYKKRPLQLNTENYLLNNACLSSQCHYYLKPIKNLHHHYFTWQPEIPPHFHIFVKENYKKSVEYIYKNFQEYFKEEEDKILVPQDYDRNQEQIKQYIQNLKKKYELIFQN